MFAEAAAWGRPGIRAIDSVGTIEVNGSGPPC